jgi:predicted small lipoprotein YifL
MPKARRYRGAMRRVVGAAAVVLGMLALSGCGTGDPIPTLPPTPSTTPVFASEEEALAAAEDAYAAYLEMSALIASDGGESPERIAPYVTANRLEEELSGFESYRELGIRAEGAPTFDVIELQRYDELSPAGAEVVIYVCWDAANVRVLNSEGTDVTPSDREVHDVLEVVLIAENSGSPLVIDSDTSWQSSTC